MMAPEILAGPRASIHWGSGARVEGESEQVVLIRHSDYLQFERVAQEAVAKRNLLAAVLREAQKSMNLGIGNLDLMRMRVRVMDDIHKLLNNV